MKATLPLFLLVQGCTGARTATEAPQPAVEVQASLPAPELLFERHVQASGGREVLLNQEQTIARFSVSIASQGIEGEMVVYQEAPNRMLASQTIEGLGESAEGYDGTVGWSVDSMMGPRVIEGNELARVRRDATLDWMLNLDEWFVRTGPVEIGELFGKSGYQVEMETHWDTVETYGFDIETGLQLGMASDLETPMGIIPIVAVFSDWREAEKGMAPHHIEQRTGPIVVECVLQELDMSPTEFPAIEVPPEIQALINDANTP